MIHGGLGYMDRSGMYLPVEIIRSLGITNGTRLCGLYYPCQHDDETASSLRHGFVLTPIPYEYWPRVGRYIVRVRHGSRAIKEISHYLAENNISVLVSEATRSGYRFCTWNLTVGFDSLKEGGQLSYEEDRSIHAETMERIMATKAAIEKKFSSLLFRDQNDLYLRESVIEIPHTALAYFYNESLRPKAPAWQYEPLAVTYRETDRVLSSDISDKFAAILETVIRHDHPDSKCLVFGAADARDMTIRVAVIPASRESAFFHAGYGYVTTGLPHSSKGLLAHVVNALPHEYSIWGMVNYTKTSSPDRECGYTSFIIEDTDLQGPNCLQKAASTFRALKDKALPKQLKHVTLIEPQARPVTAMSVLSRLQAQGVQERRYTYDVFLSYSSQDEKEALEVRNILNRNGLECFMAGKSLNTGDTFSEVIRDSLRIAGEVGILFTPAAKKSEWVTTEWGAAWALNKTIVPILLRTSPEDLPDRLRMLQCVDYHKVGEYAEQVSGRRDSFEHFPIGV